MQRINPEVWTRAELFTDGLITDALLRDVAAMHRLPLYADDVPPKPPAPFTMAELTGFERSADLSAHYARRAYVQARRGLSDANTAHLTTLASLPELRRFRAKQARAAAFRTFNAAVRNLRDAERAHRDALAALDAARIAAELGNVIPFRNAA